MVRPLVFLGFSFRNIFRVITVCTLSISEILHLQKWFEPQAFLMMPLRMVLRTAAVFIFSTSEPPKMIRTPDILIFSIRNVLRPATACTFSTSQLPNLVRTWCDVCIFISKCVSRHNGVHFFDVSTAKSDTNMVGFICFDFEMCFEPQRR